MTAPHLPRDLVLSLGELAEMFRRSPASIGAYLGRLMATEGFPPPLPGRKPRLWSRAQVEHWLALAGTPGLARGTKPAADPRLSAAAVEASRDRLAARYGGRA